MLSVIMPRYTVGYTMTAIRISYHTINNTMVTGLKPHHVGKHPMLADKNMHLMASYIICTLNQTD